GPSNAASLSVSDPLPAGKIGRASCRDSVYCAKSSGTVTCTRASLAVTTAPDITLVVTVDPARTANLSNTASVSATTSDPTTPNTSTQATTVNTSADLSIVKTDSPDPVTAGNYLTYTLSVTNAGPSNAASLSVSDPLPAG